MSTCVCWSIVSASQTRYGSRRPSGPVSRHGIARRARVEPRRERLAEGRAVARVGRAASRSSRRRPGHQSTISTISTSCSSAAADCSNTIGIEAALGRQRLPVERPVDEPAQRGRADDAVGGRAAAGASPGGRPGTARRRGSGSAACRPARAAMAARRGRRRDAARYVGTSAPSPPVQRRTGRWRAAMAFRTRLTGVPMRWSGKIRGAHVGRPPARPRALAVPRRAGGGPGVVDRPRRPRQPRRPSTRPTPRPPPGSRSRASTRDGFPLARVDSAATARAGTLFVTRGPTATVARVDVVGGFASAPDAPGWATRPGARYRPADLAADLALGLDRYAARGRVGDPPDAARAARPAGRRGLRWRSRSTCSRARRASSRASSCPARGGRRAPSPRA